MGLSGCAINPHFGYLHLSDRECLMRAMYFESIRSSEEGLLAVGTVVMNRVGAPGYPKTICGVVGQPGQFAPGVLSNPMSERSVSLVAQVADRVMHGARHPALAYTTHFHTAGYHFPYTNMHYVLVAGGNAFYEKY
jgi:spore germination cell wall hydrolase CwlJ-like protein